MKICFERRIELRDDLYVGCFFSWCPPKNHKFFPVSKFWHLELFRWDILCNLTLRTSRGAPVKKTSCIFEYKYLNREKDQPWSIDYNDICKRILWGLPQLWQVVRLKCFLVKNLNQIHSHITLRAKSLSNDRGKVVEEKDGGGDDSSGSHESRV